MLPAERRDYDSAVDAVREWLEPSALDEASAAGRTLALGDAVALALSGDAS